ncbi:CapA family protein [Brumimicrobium oceani]|uniref:Capsule synthesis protein CapA domain-containing protein n=1 Tax=Brumimicrobium oceani TaxID=2100725 RepID=A0A2U2XFC8_9FLAO|nr:CapA family protein [Brumimicrobium oceani]PWH86411.1 hypothetical protein DIT68_04005 [Brumimicrobium oceani]
MIEINIAGDFCIENRVIKSLSHDKIIFSKDFSKFWNDADFRIVNLESPITDSKSKILKSGRHIKAPTTVEKGLKKLNIDYFSLANNHIMDYGIKGLLDTIEIIEKSDSDFFGVVKEKEFYDFKIIEKGNIKVGIASFSNNEFSTFEDFNNSGALPMDLIYIFELIQKYKKEVHHIVILLHTGLSGNPLPSPNQLRLCRHLINIGASAVLCQHSHIIGAYEKYNNGFISYGQGSLAFDLNRTNTSWNEGYIVKFKFDKNKMDTEVKGLKQFDGDNQIRLLKENEKIIFDGKLKKVNEILKNENDFHYEWQKFVKLKESYYLREMFFFNNKIIRRIFRRQNFSFLYKNTGFAKFLNLFRNTEHSEIIQEILKNKSIRL